MHSALTVRGSATYGPRAEQCCSSPRGVLAARVARAARGSRGSAPTAVQRVRVERLAEAALAVGGGGAAGGAVGGRRRRWSPRLRVHEDREGHHGALAISRLNESNRSRQGGICLPGCEKEVLQLTLAWHFRRQKRRARLAARRGHGYYCSGPRLAGAAGRVRPRRLRAHVGIGGRAPPRG